jgi:putative oxidoreductase
MVGPSFAPLAYGTAVIVEVLGSIAVIIGYQTRLVAFGLALFGIATA